MLYKATLVIYDPGRDSVLLEETDECVALPRVEVAVSEPGIVARMDWQDGRAVGDRLSRPAARDGARGGRAANAERRCSLSN